MPHADDDYILGANSDEVRRLRFQHQAWVQQAYALWERAGFRAGDVVLDLGCGPGFTSFELAAIVGPSGRVIARDQSPLFLDFVRAECERLGLQQVEPSLGPVEELAFTPGSIDGTYARWLFCWLPEPGAALGRVADALKPGGVIAIQDYFDWGAMKLVPASDVVDRAIAACMRSWDEGGGTIDIAREIPTLAHEAGLEVEYFQPVARLGYVGSLEWRWLTQFFESYLPKISEAGLLDTSDLAAFGAEWKRRSAEGKSYCYTPTMADVILRKS